MDQEFRSSAFGIMLRTSHVAPARMFKGLQTSEGLTEARGSVSGMAHSHAHWLEASVFLLAVDRMP